MKKEKILKLFIIISSITLVITTCLFLMKKYIFKDSYALEHSNNLSANIVVNNVEKSFIDTNTIELEYDGNTSKVYDVNINATNIPSTATNIKLEVYMPNGMIYKSDGKGNEMLENYLKEKTIITTRNDYVYGYAYTETGKKTYLIKEGTESITLPIKVALDETFFMSKIDIPINITLTYDNNGISYQDELKLKEVTVDLSEINDVFWWGNTNYYSYVVGNNKSYKLSSLGVDTSTKLWSNSFVTGNEYPGKKKLFKKIELELKAYKSPSVIFDTYNETNISTITDNHEIIDVTKDVIIDIEENKKCQSEQTDNCWTIEYNENNNSYILTTVNRGDLTSIVSVPWTVDFSKKEDNENLFKMNDIITVFGNLNVKYYDDTEVESNNLYKRQFTIAEDNEYVWVNFINNNSAQQAKSGSSISNKHAGTISTGNMQNINVECENEQCKNKDTNYFSSDGRFRFGNIGLKDSNSKIIELNFGDSNITRVKLMNLETNCVSDYMYVKINGIDEWKKIRIVSSASNSDNSSIINNKGLINIYLDNIYLVDENKRLTNNDILNAFKYEYGIIPSLYETSNFIFGSVLKHNELNIYTIEAYDKENSTDNNHINTTGLGQARVNTQGTIATLGIGETTNKKATAGEKIDVNFKLNSADASGAYSTSNPIIYIREIFGKIDKDSITLKNSENKDILSIGGKITSFIDNEGIKVYKIDTTQVKNMEACIYCRYEKKYDNSNSTQGVNYLYVSYKIITSEVEQGGTYYYKDMLFVENPDSRYTVMSFPEKNRIYTSGSNEYNRINTNNTIEGNNLVGIGNDNLNNFIEVKTKADIVIDNKISFNNQEISWDETKENIPKISNNKEFTLTEIIKNQTGISTGKNTIIYIPIPKNDENWGEISNNQEFTWNANLVSQITNNSNKLKISYGKITPKTTYEEISSQTFINNPSNLTEINCIKIEVIENLDTNETINLNIPLIVQSTEDTENKANIFKPIYYRNITNIDNETYSGITTGKLVALKTYNESTLTVKYQDINGNKLHNDKVITKQVNESYNEQPIEIEDYIIKEINGNKEGKFLMNNQTLIFIYESTIGKNIIVKYIDEDNNIIKPSISVCDEMHKGEECEKICDEIELYTLKTESPFKITITDEVQEHLCEYEHKKGIIQAKYVLEDGTIIKEQEFSGKVNEEYEIIKEEIDGYEFINISENYKGIYKEEIEEVILTYRTIGQKEIDNPKTGIKLLYVTIPLLVIGSIIYIKKKKYTY